MGYHFQNRKGFTLLEVLIVTALTAVVLGLVFGPLIQSTRFTRNAQIMSRAQANARKAMAQISADLSDAMFVYDTSASISCPIADKDGNAWTDTDGNYYQVRFAKLDLLLPRMQGYCTSANHLLGKSREFSRNYTYTNPSDPNEILTDKNLVEAAPVCPYDQTPLELRPVQPLTPDTKIVRYFVGLQDPTVIGASDGKVHYVNPYAPFKMKRFSTEDGRSVDRNMFVLYRAEFSPNDPALFPSGRTANQNINDPDFFYNTALNNANPSQPAERYCDAWKKISRIVVTPDDMDLVTVVFDDNGSPVITPTMQFTPTVVNDDPLVPTVNKNGSAENSDAIPTMYKASYGNWTAPYKITVHRKSTDITYYTSAQLNPSTGVTELWLYKQQSGGDIPVFNITNYQNTSQAPDPTDVTWKGYQYGFGKIDSGQSGIKPELAFTIDVQRGLVNFAFPHVDVAASESLSGIMGGKTPVSFVINTKDLNDYYSGYYNGVDIPSWCDKRRFVEFNLPNSILATYTSPQVKITSTYQYFQKSTVVSQLEKVIAPNANVGQSYGMPISYSRLPFMNMFADPGINQYKLDTEHPILWGDATENKGYVPDMDGAAALYFRTETDEPGPSYRLPQYDAVDSDLTDESTGQMLLGSINNIYVLYYEQSNKQDDVITASYVTKSVMTVNLGMRVYDSSSGKPYSIQLTNKMKVKNSSS